MDNKLAILDAEDKSVSVAEARHMARSTMLLPALDALFEMGMNSTNKVSDRYNCLRLVIEFAAEAQGGGSKQVTKLSPEAARLIAKLGVKSGREKDDNGSVPPDGEARQRLRSGEADAQERETEAGAGGGLGPEDDDGS